MSSKVIQAKLPCPQCPSSDAYHEYDDGHGYCYSCGYFFNGRNNISDDSNFTYQYLPLRGINAESFRFFDVKTKVDKDGKPVALGFKYPNGAHKVRLLNRKEFYSKPSAEGNSIADAGLFGSNLFAAGSHKYVTICEGELDAISLWQVLRSPVVSAQSSSSAERDCAVQLEWLNSFERIYLALDSDAKGREAARRIARLFPNDKLFLVKFSNRKDANEYLQHGEADELRNIWWNSRNYLPETVISSFEEFKGILGQSPKWGAKYPFEFLNDMTYGIRTGESVLLTAQEGIGKTEVMHAIEHKLLKETDENVGAIFIEEPKQRHLQAISGIELGRPVHLPDSGCSVGEVFEALQEAVGRDDRLHVYSHFGSSDPGILLETIRFLVAARHCRYVLLDHITMAVSGLSGEDERKALDRLSTQLEMMVKELDFALIIVSHVNDIGQTRGSRYISKIADIRIDIDRDLLHEDPVERNTTYFKISKNRYCGKTGPAGKAWFNPATYTLQEIHEAANDNDGGNDVGSILSGGSESRIAA